MGTLTSRHSIIEKGQYWMRSKDKNCCPILDFGDFIYCGRLDRVSLVARPRNKGIFI